jgi:hypothetical protein
MNPSRDVRSGVGAPEPSQPAAATARIGDIGSFADKEKWNQHGMVNVVEAEIDLAPFGSSSDGDRAFQQCEYSGDSQLQVRQFWRALCPLR